MNGENETPAVEVSTSIAARPETVFRFFTDPARFSRWLGAAVSLSPEIGGTLRIDFARHHTVVAGEILELVPGKKLVFTWGVEKGTQTESMPAGSTTVEIVLEPVGEGTMVTLRHRGLPDEGERRDHEGGWREYLEELSRVVIADGNRERRGI